MRIYIASSWRNQHGVEMMTEQLRKKGHEVLSWIENNYGEDATPHNQDFSFEEWITTEAADHSFMYDTNGATQCDLFIYYGPAGKDACAEMGAAWAKQIPIMALYAKGEDLGLMRKMVTAWYFRYFELLDAVEVFAKERVELPM
jgi:hypothetical protein